MNSAMKNKCSVCDSKSSDIDEMIMHLNNIRHDDELFATLIEQQTDDLAKKYAERELKKTKGKKEGQ